MAQARLSRPLSAGREHAVALVDDVLDVADQMRKAELMVAPRPADLAAQPIRQPHVWPPLAQEFLDDGFGAVGLGHEGGAVAVVEDPEPPVGLAHAHARLVARQRRAGKQPLLDQARAG